MSCKKKKVIVKYLRYDNHRYDLAQTSNMEKTLNEKTLQNQLIAQRKVHVNCGKQKPTISLSKKIKNRPFCAVNPLQLDFEGPVQRERVQEREQHKQRHIELHRLTKFYEKQKLRENEKFLLEQGCSKQTLLSPILFEDFELSDVCPSLKATTKIRPTTKTVSSRSPPYLEILRTNKKPIIKAALDEERIRRIANIRNHLQKCQAIINRQHAKTLLKEQEEEAKFEYNLVEEDFDNVWQNENYKYVSNDYAKLYPIRTPKTFPNTVHEIPYFLRLQNREKRQKRDQVRLKVNVLQSLGIYRDLPDTRLKVDSVSDSAEFISQQATDSDDGLSLDVRRMSSRILIRSFHDQLKNEPRGLPTNCKKVKQHVLNNSKFQPISKMLESENFKILETADPKFLHVNTDVYFFYDPAEQECVDETLDGCINICKVFPQKMIEQNVHEPKTKLAKALKIRRHHNKHDLTHNQRVQVRYQHRHPLAEKNVSVQCPCPVGGKTEIFKVVYTKPDSITLFQETKQLSFEKIVEAETSINSLSSIPSERQRISSVVIPATFFLNKYTKEQQAIIEQASVASCCSSDDESTSIVDFSNDSGSQIIYADGKMVSAHAYINNKMALNNKVLLEEIIGNNPGHMSSRAPPGPMVALRKLSRKQVHIQEINKCLEVDNLGKQIKTMDYLDNYFLTEIKNRPKLESFQKNKYFNKLRLNLRHKLIKMWVFEDAFLANVRNRIETNLAKVAESFAEICPSVLNKWGYEYFKRAMSQIDQVKPTQQQTDAMRERIHDLENYFMKLNMEIVRSEHKWIHRLGCQNFLYMLKGHRCLQWQEKYAWMHRRTDGSIFSAPEAIFDRLTTVQCRENETGLAILEFYNEYFVAKSEPPIPVFNSNTREFLKVLSHIKRQNLRQTIETQCQIWALIDVKTKFLAFKKWVDDFLGKKEWNNCIVIGKKQLQEAYAVDMKKQAKTWLDGPLQNSVDWQQPWRLRAAILALKNAFFPIHPQQIFSVSDRYQFFVIEQIVQNAFTFLDQVPSHVTSKLNEQVHAQRKKELRAAEKANIRKKRHEINVHHFERSLEPPFQKPLRFGKLPRSYVRVERKKPKSPPQMTDRQKLLYAAFMDDIAPATATLKTPDIDKDLLVKLAKFEKDCLMVVDVDEEDELDDYEPETNIVTQVELRDGPEEQYAKCKDVLPSVERFMMFWQRRRDSLKKLEIKRKDQLRNKR